jgi:hypothetical protein
MQHLLSLFQSILTVLAHTSILIPIVLLLAVVLIFLRIPVLTDILSLPVGSVRWFFSTRTVFNNKNWSVVYDSSTKLPIDPAYITVRNPQGVEMATMITDLNGRFALILPRGLYRIEAQKANYVFPALSLNGAPTDGMYTALYYGGIVEVLNAEQAVTIAIPMDPMGTDWNQKEKKRHNVFLRFGKESVFALAELIYLLIGAIFLYAHYHFSYNFFYNELATAYATVLAAILIWRLFQSSSLSHGIVIDRRTKQPVGFARVSIFTAKNRLLSKKTTSFNGQFTALVPQGKYYVTIEKRQTDGSYTLVYTSHTFHAREGIIGKKFVV